MRLTLNPQSVIFLPEVDRRNGWETVVCDWNKEEFVKINAEGYQILRAISDHRIISSAEVAKRVGLDPLKVERFLQEMRSREVVRTV